MVILWWCYSGVHAQHTEYALLLPARSSLSGVQGCYKSVTGVLQGCYNIVTRVLQ
jgi:hypothetical protein